MRKYGILICVLFMSLMKLCINLHNFECYFRKHFTPLCKVLLGLVSAIDSLCSKSKAVVRRNRLNVMKESHFISLLLYYNSSKCPHLVEVKYYYNEFLVFSVVIQDPFGLSFHTVIDFALSFKTLVFYLNSTQHAVSSQTNDLFKKFVRILSTYIISL